MLTGAMFRIVVSEGRSTARLTFMKASSMMCMFSVPRNLTWTPDSHCLSSVRQVGGSAFFLSGMNGRMTRRRLPAATIPRAGLRQTGSRCPLVVAHLVRDNLHDIYAGCGFDAACSYIP